LPAPVVPATPRKPTHIQKHPAPAVNHLDDDDDATMSPGSLGKHRE
jgi:hypothetical protein